jgi:hypothetical protein
MVYASGRTLLSGSSPDIVAALFAILALCFLGLLIVGAPITLWTVNHQLRKSLPATPAPENLAPPSRTW